jgi:LysR family glycine cleavage system transcriptional activator
MSEYFEDVKDPFDVIIWRSPLERSGYDCVRFLDDVSVPLASPHFLETHPIRVPRDSWRCR